METSISEQGSSKPRGAKIDWVILSVLAGVIKRWASLMQWSEAEREEAGIHIERMDGE